jgi:hypothetical protein
MLIENFKTVSHASLSNFQVGVSTDKYLQLCSKYFMLTLRDDLKISKSLKVSSKTEKFQCRSQML